MIANTPNPPYYAVIFTSIKTDNLEGYNEMTKSMIDLAHQQEGFLGVESAEDTIGITVSYWKDPDAIAKWKSHFEHQQAQAKGKSHWYKLFTTRVAKVERDYSFQKTSN